MTQKTIKFIDATEQGEGVVILEASKDRVGMCFSLASDGDIEVFLSPKDAIFVAEAILEFARAAMSS
jgi:hypothetical protein